MTIYVVSYLQQFSFSLLEQTIAEYAELPSEEYRFDSINCFNGGGKEIEVRKG
jgi:hypothetical protein